MNVCYPLVDGFATIGTHAVWSLTVAAQGLLAVAICATVVGFVIAVSGNR